MTEPLDDLAARMATLHEPCFMGAERWSAATFRTFLEDANVFSRLTPHGLVLCRQMGDEAELLTICTLPAMRGQGEAQQLLAWALAEAAARGVKNLHLEVAEDNPPAQKLYLKAGFVQVGRRPHYYQRADRAAAALLFRKDIV